MKPEVPIESLQKQFGSRRALHDVSLHLEAGLYGLLGRNGAGKTTLMRILATLLNKSGGEVFVCGIPVEKAAAVRPLIGYLPQEFGLYPQMTVTAAMEYLGTLSGLSRRQYRERIPGLLQMVNLDDCGKLKVRALSGGMRRRLGIAQAILHDPKVLIVDEPTAGLDPEERARFRELLAELAAERVVLLSTHITEDVEKTCENLGVLEKGKLVYHGSLAAFTQGFDSLEAAYLHRIGGETP
jgi:ABC-2 type transport system ATP-binding protein